jgi:hypothetical protein
MIKTKMKNLKEIATELGYLNEDRFAGFADKPTSKKDYLGRNLDKLKRSIKNPVSKDSELNKDLFKKYISTYKKVEFVYTEQGGRFYGLDVYENKDQDQRSAKLRYDEANKWLKNTLSLDIDIPERYGSGMKELDSIVKKLEDLGIEASHGDYMDVS